MSYQLLGPVESARAIRDLAVIVNQLWGPHHPRRPCSLRAGGLTNSREPPAHLPLPAKIRTEILDPIELDDDPERVDDEAHVESIYKQVRADIQAGMDRLASRRSFPVMG